MSSAVVAEVGLWQLKSASKSKGETDLLLQLDIEQMAQGLQQAANEQSLIELPLPDGSYKKVAVQVTQTLSITLQQKFPNVRTYKVLSDDAIVVGRIDLSPAGFHAMLHTATGKIAYIDPITDVADQEEQQQEQNMYHSYWEAEPDDNMPEIKAKRGDTHQCALVHDHAADADYNIGEKLQQNSGFISDSAVHKYRLAVSATGEYTAQHGGTKATALAAIASTINRINHIYERDVAIHFELVDNNDQLIFTDSRNDPFYGNVDDFLQQNQTLITNIIGSDHYDVGHLFTTKGGGVALVGGACRTNVKAMGVSGYPASERFDLAFVAHELGHQFGATHTFSGTAGLCFSSNRAEATAYEPGSGSTIMSYAGICASDNVQTVVDPLFHIASIQQMSRHKEKQWDKGCGEVFQDNANILVVDGGEDYVIPANTPFLLRGEIVTQSSNNTVYNWEQVDSGTASNVDVDTGDNALFRTFLPTSSTQRIFPRLAVILGEKQALGEALPTQSRVMNFQFVAQDSQGMTVSDAIQVHVHQDTEQFGLETPQNVYQKGIENTLVWQVANTNLPPVSCAVVDITLSLDNGHHFDWELAHRVANTGLATIVIPTDLSNSSAARFKLSCSDNIFFSISNRSFAISDDKNAVLSSSDNTVNSSRVTQGGGGGGSFSVLFLFLLGMVCSAFVGVKRYFCT